VPKLQRIEVIPVEKINSKMRQCGVTFLFGGAQNSGIPGSAQDREACLSQVQRGLTSNDPMPKTAANSEVFDHLSDV
jgi:hypothetical protein